MSHKIIIIMVKYRANSNYVQLCIYKPAKIIHKDITLHCVIINS